MQKQEAMPKPHYSARGVQFKDIKVGEPVEVNLSRGRKIILSRQGNSALELTVDGVGKVVGLKEHYNPVIEKDGRVGYFYARVASSGEMNTKVISALQHSQEVYG
jgi:hypothetical protein